VTADDLFQDLAVKDLENNLEKMAWEVKAPFKPYLVRSPRNDAIDSSKKMRAGPMPKLPDGETDFEPVARPARAPDAQDRFELTMSRLTDKDIESARKDLDLLDRHHELPCFSAALPGDSSELSTSWNAGHSFCSSWRRPARRGTSSRGWGERLSSDFLA